MVAGTKLITFPIKEGTGECPNMRKEWIMNPNGKSYVCILHEYVQHALKKQPTYKFTELGQYLRETWFGLTMGDFCRERRHALPGDGVDQRHAVRRGLRHQQETGEVGGGTRHPRDPDTADEEQDRGGQQDGGGGEARPRARSIRK